MKAFLIALNIVIWSFVGYQATAHAEVKKVCHIDAKTKKEVCKNIKVHKKVDGTPVPVKKK